MDGSKMIKPYYDLIIKLIIIGDTSVGKSSWLARIFDERWMPNMTSTIGIDFRVKTVLIDGKIVKIQVWDTAGQERFQTITKAYYRGVAGAIIMYDVTNRKSFYSINKWIDALKDSSGNNNIFRCIVGTKNDLTDSKDVPDDDARTLAEKFGIPLYLSSAKTGENVDEIFNSIVEQSYNLIKPQKVIENLESTGTGVNIAETNIPQQKCC
ncbi:MAG: ras-related protein RIC1 isoform X2 [Satyrvirus sp.]|uniref:Ras-related protein RIC1 isoform X2 n=1 Tax=Satyrvirus sp. TaxID=2487771 RepID=A0A3G5AGM5_9VIRU|nr:MAG: ras-related protein RIC1 isoform X2 [Satyrvirus sp.]